MRPRAISIVSLSLALLCAKPSLSAICESTDWRTNLTADELVAPQMVLRGTVDDAHAFAVISSGCEPTPLVVLYAVFAKPEIEHSPGAWLRETVRCQKPPWTPDPWRCTKPYSVIRFTAGDISQTVRLSAGIDADSVLAIGRYMTSNCFKSQFDALPEERRDRIKSQPFIRIRWIIREMHNPDLFRVRVAPFVSYILRPVAPAVSECAFNIERIYRGGPH